MFLLLSGSNRSRMFRGPIYSWIFVRIFLMFAVIYFIIIIQVITLYFLSFCVLFSSHLIAIKKKYKSKSFLILKFKFLRLNIFFLC